MTIKESIEQLESLIEAWQLDEADLNQTDINAIKQMLNKNKKLKEQLQASEKTRKEAIKYVKKTSGYDNPYNDTFLNTYAVDNLLEILDKGE